MTHTLPTNFDQATWKPDILGGLWHQATIEVDRDLPDEPTPRATLVTQRTRPTRGELGAVGFTRAGDEGSQSDKSDQRGSSVEGGHRENTGDTAVLYVHGYNDYFFQTHLGTHITGAGYDFYALDLRRCGRAWQQEELPHYITDLKHYFPEITAAMQYLHGHYRNVVLLGHSTGGLTSALWVDEIQRSEQLQHLAPAILVLNSPWIALQGPWWWRIAARTAAYTLAPLRPTASLGGLSEHYSKALHHDSGGEWEFDLSLKPHLGIPARAAWLRAVMRGHRSIWHGLKITCPILVCTSQRSGPRSKHHSGMLETDSVLTAERLRHAAPKLGSDVQLAEFAGAHDLALSPRPIRDQYLNAVTAWIAHNLDT